MRPRACSPATWAAIFRAIRRSCRRTCPAPARLNLVNYLYNVAPKDGTAFGIFARGMAMEPLIGGSNAKFDATKLTWIGSAANEISLCATFATSPVKTWNDALTKEFTVAGNGSGSDPDVFANVLRNLFGVKDRLISGFPGSAEISLAMERGEVDGRCGWSWSSIKAEKSAWLAEHKLNLIVQLALEKAADLPDVPLITDLATDDRQRQILKLIFSRQTMGRPFAGPPGIPADRARGFAHGVRSHHEGSRSFWRRPRSASSRSIRCRGTTSRSFSPSSTRPPRTWSPRRAKPPNARIS